MERVLVLLLGANAGRLAVLALQAERLEEAWWRGNHSCPLCRGPSDEIGEVGVLKLELNALVQIVLNSGAPGRAGLNRVPP